jgi:hypothetical protein
MFGRSAPVAQLVIVQFAYRTFVRFIGRDPVDAAFNWREGIFPDRVYGLVVLLGGILPFLAAMAPKS